MVHGQNPWWCSFLLLEETVDVDIVVSRHRPRPPASAFVHCGVPGHPFQDLTDSCVNVLLQYCSARDFRRGRATGSAAGGRVTAYRYKDSRLPPSQNKLLRLRTIGHWHSTYVSTFRKSLPSPSAPL